MLKTMESHFYDSGIIGIWTFQASVCIKKDLLEIPVEVKIQFNEEPSIRHKAYC